jgi:ATP phosphoribosyltransferase
MMETEALRLALPKGRMYDEVVRLLQDAGVRLRVGDRAYRPQLSLQGFETKILKPQTIVEMLDRGSRDVGFAGADWVAEKQATLVEILDLKLDPVRIVAAAPRELLVNGRLPTGRKWVIASEYERLTNDWIVRQGLDATFVRSYGATEVFPPEDADCIVDNTATGSTLRANGLEIFDDVMRSSTRLFANPRALDDAARRDRIEHLALLLRSVLDARSRVMLEINVGPNDLERLVSVLPCMREPTVATLHGGAGYAVKAAVPRELVPELIPLLKAHGGADIVVSALSQIVP